MICSNNNQRLSIDFQKAGELFPTEVNFKTQDDSYDTLICKFNSEVATSARDALDNETSLTEVQRATLKMDGEAVKAMYYKPEFFNLGEHIGARDYYGTLELHDLHEQLKNGFVDYAPQETTIEEVYTKIEEGLDDSDNIIKDIVVNLPNADESVSSARNFDESQSAGFLGASSAIENNELIDLDFNWVINFDEQSPLRSIQEANNKFALSSHASPDGKIVVGQYESDNTHVANKERDSGNHLVKSVGVTGNRSNLGKLILEGGITGPSLADNPGNWADEVGEYWNPFNDAGGRIRAKTVIETPTDGRTVTLEAHDLLPRRKWMFPVAKRAFLGIVSRNPSGTITLDFNNGAATNIQIGDKIQLEEPEACGDLSEPAYWENEFIITGVNHNYDSSWDVSLNVINDFNYLIENIDISMQYWDISDGQGYTRDELYGTQNQNDDDGFADTVEDFLN